jgi:hypothetical protein
MIACVALRLLENAPLRMVHDISRTLLLGTEDSLLYSHCHDSDLTHRLCGAVVRVGA